MNSYNACWNCRDVFYEREGIKTCLVCDRNYCEKCEEEAGMNDLDEDGNSTGNYWCKECTDKEST